MAYKPMKENIGLRVDNMNLIVATLAVILLVFGPGTNGIVRLSYTTILPALSWYALNYFGKSWEINETENNHLNGIIIGMIAGAFFFSAYSEYITTPEVEMATVNIVPANVFMITIFGISALFIAIVGIKRESD